MKRMYLLLVVLTLFLTAFIPNPAAALASLDEIANYTVSITPWEDGSLYMKYHLEWTVLDDKKEGPLTWVKVGIPNSHVDQITALSPSIRNIRYLSDNGGDYVRIDLDREYTAGETVTLDFQIHQSYMYAINKQDQKIIFSFTPGWFDDIEVKSITVIWESKGAAESNAPNSQDGSFVWQASLQPGKRLNARVIYPMDAMKIVQEEKQTKEEETKEEAQFPLWGALLIFGGVSYVFYWLSRLSHGGYRGGFGGRGGGSGTTSCACVCACACGCACACACASGGRAGCSVKPLYRPSVSVVELQKALRNLTPQRSVS